MSNDRWFWIGIALAVLVSLLGYATIILAVHVGYLPM
jgi:hypothetical protein